MSTLMLTLVLAFAIVIIALALLAIGWLFTGKSRIQPGACGRAPHQKRGKEEECGKSTSCSICDKEDKT